MGIVRRAWLATGPALQGANDLIREGAHFTECAADVLANLPDHHFCQGVARDPLFQRGSPGLAELPPAWEEPREDATALTRGQREIPGIIGADPVGVDERARRCQLSNTAVTAVHLELELGDQVETHTGNRMVRHADL